jgi:hypothetical protein
MAQDLLDRVLQEIREGKQASRSAYEESQHLERALAALDQEDDGAVEPGRRGRARDSTARRRPRAAPGANRAAIVTVGARERPGMRRTRCSAT